VIITRDIAQIRGCFFILKILLHKVRWTRKAKMNPREFIRTGSTVICRYWKGRPLIVNKMKSNASLRIMIGNWIGIGKEGRS
jgi:hypothetical protein